MKKINDFDTQIQSDELASLGEGSDWINDVETDEDEFIDD